MNKIKVMYDVVRAMQDKEVLNGTMHVEVLTGDVKVWELNNEFHKNRATGLNRAKIRTELSLNGTNLAHESTTEFRGDGHCSFKHRRHGHHHHGAHGSCRGNRLSLLATALKLLNDMEVSEQQGGNKLISLRVDELPAELKLRFQKAMEHRDDAVGHGHLRVLHELLPLEEAKLTIEVRITSSNEIQGIHMVLQGKKLQQDGSDKAVAVHIKVILN